MASYILYGSLVVILVLFVIQTLRLQKTRRVLEQSLSAAADLERLSQLGRLLAGIAHELNTPISAVRCSVGTRNQALGRLATELEELIGDGDTEGRLAIDDLPSRLERLQKLVTTAQDIEPVLDEALGRVQLMVEHLRQAGRKCPANGNLTVVDPDPIVAVDIKAVLDSSLLLVRHELKTGIEVVLDLPPTAPVAARSAALGQIFINLLVNAAKAMDGVGKISVRAVQIGDRVRIDVADSGPGLPAGVGDEIFAADFTTRSAEEGTGLGLYISRKIVDSLDGHLTAANGPAGGAVFTIDLPVADAADR